MERSKIEAVISTQVLAEVAGVLYGQFGVRDTTRYVAGILSYRLRVRPVTSEVIRLAAEHSRDYQILPYDAIHVVTALGSKVDEMISADKEMDRVKRLVKRRDPLDYK